MPDDYDVRLKSNGNYWQAFWVDPATRDPKAKSLGPKAELSRRQAEQACRRLAVDLRMGIKRDGAAPRLSEWVAQYKRLRTDVDPKTMALIDHTGRYLLAYFTNDPPIDRITRADMADWRAALARGELRRANVYPKPDDRTALATKYQKYRKALKDKPPKALSAATVAKHVRTAKRMFEEATDENGVGHVKLNPMRKLSGRAPKPAKSWATVTLDDLRKILDACPDDGWRCLFALCRMAGLRRQEALDLRWRDVLWTENKLMVNAAIERETTKRAKRVAPIEPARCPTGLLAILQKAYDAAPEGSDGPCAGVSLDNIDRQARAIVAAAGIAPYADPFHALRKNRAGEVAAQYPQHVLTEWLGHDADVAETFYLRVEESLYAAPPPPAGQVAQNAAQTTPVAPPPST